MPLGFTSPGANFSGGFEDYLMKQSALEHQNMLDDLANKREQRMAQAELDSHAERQDELARKKAKDLSDAKDKQTKDYEKQVSGMVKGDRPSPEMIEQGQKLGVFPFRQGAPAMSTDTMQPPAALMEAPPAGASAAGAELPTPAGAMAPGPTTYPGSHDERIAEADRERQKAFIEQMPDTDPRKQELKTAFEAEAAGLKVPAGYFSKSGSANGDEAVMRQNPRKGTVERMVDGQWSTWTGDVPKGAHWMTEPPPKDTSVHDLAAENARQRNIEHANKRLYDELGKGELSKIVAAGDIQDALAQNTEVADATLAPLVLKSTITAGGNSGFRMTKPEIDRVLTRDVWDDLSLKLHAWTGNGPLQLTPGQKDAMRKLASAIYDKAAMNYAKINAAEDKINNAKDAHEINSIVTDTKRMFEPGSAPKGSTLQGPPPAVGKIRYDSSGMIIPPPQGAR